ncbi:MAG: GldG family protein [Clostridia bacterium]|nr:ABC transporter [Bacillota bacterium]
MAELAPNPAPRRISSGVRAAAAAGGVLAVLAGAGLYLWSPSLWGWALALAAAGLAAVAFAALAGRDLAQLRSSRSLYYGTSATVLTVAVIAIVALVNVIAERDFHVRWDLTAEKLYSLSDQTLQVLRELDRPVTVYAFVRDDSYGRQVVDLIREYTYRSNQIRMQVIDPDAQPSLARAFEVTQYNTVVVEAGDQRRTVSPYDMFSLNLFGQLTEFRGELALTRALIGVTRGTQGKVYFTTGHGERDLSRDLSQFRSFLTGEGYEVEAVNLAQAGEVPADASVLVIAGPIRDFDPREIEAVQAYIQEGGRVLLLLDPAPPNVDLQRIAGLLAPWGITFRADLVVDPERHYFIDPLSPIPELRLHEVTATLAQRGLGVVLTRARSIAVEDASEAGARVQALLETSASAWGETRLGEQQLARDEDDAHGPLAVGAAAEAGSARLVAVGSSSLAGNDGITFQGNLDFVVNAVNWLAGKEENLTIRPKSPEYRYVTLTSGQANVIFYSTVIGVPALFLVAAGIVAWRRRRL